MNRRHHTFGIETAGASSRTLRRMGVSHMQLARITEGIITRDFFSRDPVRGVRRGVPQIKSAGASGEQETV